MQATDGRALWRDRVLLVAVGLLVNAIVAALVDIPGYPDAYYYFNGGQRLFEGYDFTDPYLWNYLNAPGTLPAPSHTYWQPLPSLLGWLGMSLFGPTFNAAQVPFVLLAAALPLVTHAVTLRLGGSRRQAFIAGLITVFSGFYLVFWTNTEAFTPFALVGALSLLLTARARQTGKAWMWFVAGALVAPGHLSRADGLLLLLVALIVALWPGEGLATSLRGAALATLGYLLVMTPWFARNIVALGRPLPTGGLDTLFLIEYNDLFLLDQSVTVTRYFESGIGAILAGKGRALLLALGTFILVHNLVFLAPFTLVGWWRRWREVILLPALLYGLGLYAAMTLAFTFPGARGGLFHSGGALLPFIFSVGVLGLDDVLAWVARRRPSWRPEQASRVFGVAFVALAGLVSGYLVSTRIVGRGTASIAWNQQDAVYAEIGTYLEEEGLSDARVMSNNPPGFYYHTGLGGVPIPNGDEGTLLRAARVYGVDYVVIDKNLVPDLWPVYQEGPESDALQLVERFRPDNPVYLYRLKEE